MKRITTAALTGGYSEYDRALTGGQLTEVGTGGLVKSKKTESLEAEANAAQAKQAALVADEKKRVIMEEKERRDRVLRSRQGRRSLLWQPTGELGVQKKTTLGG